eukprot:TRINITY_DN74341_c0_g1_i1.p1 TRINITY_DN74341_c0_g1~~TRINITY_DN74341_c0_g1_i1.p1  ORF type:complete len:334 (+),score=57.02 TRINITY_DN74341_c0_g1_i1:78-1079(+)
MGGTSSAPRAAGEACGSPNDAGVTPAPAPNPLDCFHYGVHHHLDAYEAPGLEDQILRMHGRYDEYLQLRAKRKDAVNRNERSMHRDLMERHVAKVRAMHQRLESVGKLEGETLYDPRDYYTEGDSDVSYEEWQSGELAKLIKRREAAMALDLKRPDLNRTGYELPLYNYLCSPSTGLAAFEGAPTEPGHWGKRRYYYPVTDFSQLESPQDVSDEERMLKKAYEGVQDDPNYMWMTIGGVLGTIIGVSFRHVNTIGTVAVGLSGGYFTDKLQTSFKTAYKIRDLDDYLIAKQVWFLKNRPEVFSSLDSGLREARTVRMGQTLSSKPGLIGNIGT